MFKIFDNTAPSYLSEQFEHVQNQHHYQTRGSSHSFIVPGVNSAGRYSFLGGGALRYREGPHPRYIFLRIQGSFLRTSACPTIL